MVYQVILEPITGNWFIAEYPALPGCVAEGKNKNEALTNLKQEIGRRLSPLKN
ncbi:type II toxin-antitoxin system HicB family antitoxin [Candidatus Cyanaurora vandensis]|uniref:type II toxin-antitoxin system HicB family antitoxin n=1 Tax=Candidatus Cyanaurora vandensis TaxID=2714958 RepID=UPI00257AB753|nr:type II toxin-antitoxin system HicB family antitoxin [Candidatus Cyanaurora vandensis]